MNGDGPANKKSNWEGDLMNAENKELLALFEPLRVADVRDGMDWMGYHH